MLDWKEMAGAGAAWRLGRAALEGRVGVRGFVPGSGAWGAWLWNFDGLWDFRCVFLCLYLIKFEPNPVP